jgi:hypothetical protein
MELSYREQLMLLSGEWACKSLGILPFISKNRITILNKGLYEQKKPRYKGVGLVDGRAILLGFYEIPYNMIIQPEGLELTEGKKKLIESYCNKGYILIKGFPSLHIKEFDTNSEEYRVAKGKQKEQIRKNDTSSNKPRGRVQEFERV